MGVGVLILLQGPSVPNPNGEIKSITNVLEPGSNGLVWAYENQSGVIRGTRSYKNRMRVITNTAFMGPIAIQNALIGIGAVQGSYYQFPLPELNGTNNYGTIPYEIDTGSFLHSLSIQQDPAAEDCKQWLCDFEYGPLDINHEFGSSEQDNGTNNPLEKAPEVSWSAPIEEISTPNDINGIPFVNTAGSPLENPPKRTESRQTLVFVRNEATYDDNYAQTFRQTVNQYVFLGFPPNCAKCKTITGKRIYTSDFGYYWEVTYEFEFRVITEYIPDTFDPITGLNNNDGSTTVFGYQDRVLNAGFFQIVNNAAVPILINGIPPSTAQPLDQNGVLQLPGSSGDSGDPSDEPEPYFLVFNQYFQQDFTALNIPADILTTNQ